MEMVIRNDPLPDPANDKKRTKFGEIYCDEEGFFIYVCDFCPSRTRLANDVEQHFLTHFNDVFQSKKEKLSLLDNEYAQDNECRKLPSKGAQVSIVNLIIPSLPLECDTCGWRTKHHKNLKEHIRTHNNKETSYNYEEIDHKIEPLPSHGSDTVQPKRKKSTKPVINCQLCAKEFHCRKYLDKHIENHPFYPAIFECDFCGKRVKERKDFMEHMKRAHIGIKYPCRVCGKQFAQSSYVLIHMRMHNQNRGHQCEVCGRTFFTSGALTSHMRKHNNTLNVLPCNICGKIFHLPGALRDHTRVHSGEKPFKCDICQSSFRTRKFLSQHKSVHLEAKQFSCELCGKFFKQSSGKRIHKRKVHGKLIGTGQTLKL